MGTSGMVERRSILKAAAAFGGLSALAVVAPAVPGSTRESETPAAASPEVKLENVPAGPNSKVTIERRGQIVLIGINRPHIQNRIDPETFEKLAEAYYQYDHDLSLRAAILFGHGENFSRGIDVEGFRSLAGTGKPWIASTGTIDPLAKRAPRLTKPLIVVTHGDTWIWPMSSILLPTSELLQPTPASARMRIHTDAFPEEDRPSGSRRK